MSHITSQSIGIIGAGTMGKSLAADCILHGLQVTLVDLDEKLVQQSIEEIMKFVKFAPLLNPSLTKLRLDAARSQIVGTTQLEDVRECDFVVENVNEVWEVKQEVYTRLKAIVSSLAFVGANTSCLSITQLGGLTEAPDKVIGMHFMNPTYLKSTVEVIRGFHTSERTIEAAQSFLSQLNKHAIIVNDLPGFVSNRISHLYMNEAAFVIQDGVASPAEVDDIFKHCYGHKMGPLETADLIGLDTVVDSLKVLYDSYQDSKYRCCPLLQKMVHAGRLGRKSGHGFYDY